jgi:hypothetical protein
MASIDPLADFELPRRLVSPALNACRLFNTCLDGLFYDVPTLTRALHSRDDTIVTSDPGNAATPKDDINLSADTDPEGSLLVIDPATPPYVTAWRDVGAYVDDQKTRPEPVAVATITGVGSSALGGAALAWNVAVGLERPVLAIVPGYGVADVVLQGLGGWFGFGLYDALSAKTHVQDYLALVAPRTAAIGRSLSDSAPGRRRLNGAPAFRTGCGSSDVLHALMEALPIRRVAGHSKGALSIFNALHALPAARLEGLEVLTLGCPIKEDLDGVTYTQVLGSFDLLGALNAWGNRPTRWVGADHSTSTAFPLSLPVEAIVRAWGRAPQGALAG